MNPTTDLQLRLEQIVLDLKNLLNLCKRTENIEIIEKILEVAEGHWLSNEDNY